MSPLAGLVKFPLVLICAHAQLAGMTGGDEYPQPQNIAMY